MSYWADFVPLKKPSLTTPGSEIGRLVGRRGQVSALGDSTCDHSLVHQIVPVDHPPAVGVIEQVVENLV